MYKKLLKKPLSFLLSFSLLLQNFTPLLVLPVYAEDSTTSAETTPVIPSEVEESPSITPTPSPEPTPEVTPETTPTPTEEVSPTPTVEPTPDTTPTPTEVITPVPTPEITPEITVTPEPTPTTAPEVTPAPASNGDAQAPPQENNQSTVIPDSDQESINNSTEPTVPESITIAAQIENQESSPTLSTDKADYFPTEIVHISGTGFDPNTTYTLHIISSDSPFVSFYVDVTSDENGNLKYDYQLDGHYRPNYNIEALNSEKNIVATYAFTDGNSGASLEQCRNGSKTSPNNCESLGGGTGWVNGNAGTSNSHYVEGLSIPYRAVMDGMPVGTTVNLVIEYDITHSGAHAIDFLTHYDRLDPHSPFGHTKESIDPLSGVTGVSGTVSTFAIPAPSSIGSPAPNQPTLRFNSLPSSEKLMTLFGGNITAISYVSEGVLTGSNSSTSIQVSFVPDSTKAVLAWGGHIAQEIDWGLNMSAGGISGSPYHMRLDSWTLGNLGNQDRSLSADAVAPPSSITIIKDSQPDNSQDFSFSTTGNGISNFTLDDDSDSVLSNSIQFNSLLAGTFSITENSTSGWTLNSVVCSSDGNSSTNTPITNGVSINLAAGENVTCTFANTQDQATLIINKTAIGGDDTFNYTVTGPTSLTPGITTSNGSGTTGSLTVSPGSYTVLETVPSGWSLTSTDCSGSFVIANGETKTCNFTNTKNSTITVNKIVTNNDGGQKLASQFPLFVGTTQVTNGVAIAFPSGSYVISETGDSDYTATYGGDCDANGNLTLAAGQNLVCNITNDDIPATLIVKKVIKNDNGGTSNFGDFSFKVNTGDSTPFDTDGQNEFTVDAGTYNIVEISEPGYSTTYDNCSNVVLGNGDTATCTITNDDQPATLTVVKNLNKQYGGTLSCTDFSFKVNGGSSIPFEADCSNTLSVNADTYTVVEDPEAGYNPSYLNCTSIVLDNGGSATCTITNDDQPATLIVKKVVVNDNGGTKTAQDFTFKVNNGADTQFIGTGLTGEVTLTVNNGNYSIVENSDSQYTTTYDNCSNLNIGNGGSATCTITNNDKPSTLTLVKTVTNNNGGTLDQDDFPVWIDSNTATWGANTVNAGSYTVSETSQTGYSPSVWGGDCAESGNISLLPGDSKTCTITNDDIPARLKVIKVVDNGNTGASFTSSDFQMKVDGGNVSQNEFFNVLPGTHNITESGPSGYSTGFSDSCSGGSITLALGEEKTCTVTNTAIAPTLTLVKTVTNNNGGTKTASDFQAYIDSVAVLWSGPKTLTVGSHTASEDLVAGYTASAWGGDCAANGSIILSLGFNKTCTITNDDQAGTLIVRKVVVGSQTLPSNFSFFVNSGAPVDFEVDGQNNISVNAGVYTVSETPDENYSTTYENCSRLDIGIGETETCTITNTKYGSISGYKYEDENGDGDKGAGENYLNDWNIKLYDNAMNELSSVVTGSGSWSLGQYKFTNLLPGVYNICEVNQDGWLQTDPGTGCRQRTVNAGSAISGVNFGNFKKAKITVHKDVLGINRESVEDDTEFIVWLNNEIEKAVSENSDAVYDNLGPDTYIVTEPNLPSGYELVSIENNEITVQSGGEYDVYITNKRIPATLIVQKVIVGSEEAYENFSFSINQDEPISFEEDGRNELSVDRGTYTITEPSVEGYTTTYNNCEDINIANGETETCTITNTKMGKITFTKETNLEEDETVFEFETNFTEGNVRLSNGGTYDSGYLQPGTYSITELASSGWTLTGATCSDKSDPSNIELSAGEEVTCTFRNEFVEPALTISKSNDATTDKIPGSSVIFRILLSLTGSQVSNLTVKDLLPKGFVYRTGSYKVFKNGTNVTALLSEPEYHSPGTWNLGNAQHEDDFELVYTADIATNQLPGDYLDVAWAQGTSLIDESVMALAQTEGYVDTNFSGTTVSVVKDQSGGQDYNVEKKEEVKGQVLGASTSLPATGAKDIWLLIALCSIFMGIKLVRSSKLK